MLRSLLILGAAMVSGISFHSPAFAETLAPIRVGATLALSGKLAFSGISDHQGLELAIEDINSQGGIGGRKLELIAEDNGGDPKSALSSVSKLFDADHIDFLFSAFSHVTQAVKDRAKRSGKIMIYHASLGDIAKESKLFFRDWGDAESQSHALLNRFVEDRRKKAAYLGETSEACVFFDKMIRGEAATSKFELVASESYTPGETDLKPLLLRISAKSPDALYTCTWRDGALLMSQMKALHLIHIPTYQALSPFIPINDTSEVRKLYEENHAVSVWLGFVPGDLTPEQKKFFERIAARYHTEPRIEALLAYDDASVLAKAAAGCVSSDSIDQNCVAERLRKTHYKGLAGSLCFDELDRSNRPNLLIRVEQGAWKKVSQDAESCPPSPSEH